MDAIVAISRTRKALRRAYFAADERRDAAEVVRIGRIWNDVDAKEKAMPACSARDVQAKLKWAAYFLVDMALATRLLHVGASVVRNGPELGQLVELRECLVSLRVIEPELDIGVVEDVRPRIEAAIAWLARPHCVSSLPAPS
jgi:hypothetical protein